MYEWEIQQQKEELKENNFKGISGTKWKKVIKQKGRKINLI